MRETNDPDAESGQLTENRLSRADMLRSALILILVTVSMARAVPISRISASADVRLDALYSLTASEQRWSMFSNPGNISRTTEADIVMSDGSVKTWKLPELSAWRILADRRISKASEAIQDPDQFDYWPILAEHIKLQAEQDESRVSDVVLVRVLQDPPNFGEDGTTTMRREPFYNLSEGILPWDSEGFVE